MALKVGDVFDRYEDFKRALKAYEDESFVNYTVTDSTSVERARKKQPKRTFR